MALDPFDVLNASYARLGLSPLRQQRTPRYSLSPNEEQSLLRSLASGSLSGLAAVGNLLDVPGSMVRDVLAGENPLDQLLSPFSSEGRTTGRDLLRKAGLAGRRDTIGNFIGGLGAEIALDPLAWVTFGSSAVARKGAGGLIKAAGLLDDATRVATKKMGRLVGPREARMLVTPREILREVPREFRRDAFSALRTAAEKKGIGVGQARKLLDQPLGGLAGIGVPFQDAALTLGKAGGAAQAVARGMDVAGRAVRYGRYSPVRPVAELFDAAGWGMKSVPAKLGAKRLFWAREGARATSRGFSNELLDLAVKEGLDDSRIDDVMKLFEGTVAPANQNQAKMVELFRRQMDTMQAEAAQWGLKAPVLDDAFIKYNFRQLSKGYRDVGNLRVFSTADPSDHARFWAFRNLPGGTPTIRAVAMDKTISALIDSGKGARRIAKEIEKRFPIEQWGEVLNGVRRSDAFARKLKSIPRETRQVGIFGNHPIFDAQSRLKNHLSKIEAAREVIRTLATPKVLETSKVIEGTQPLGTVLKKLGMRKGDENIGAIRKLAQAIGAPINADTVKRLGKMRVRDEIADDLVRMMDQFGKAPGPVASLTSAFDSVSNAWKSMVTSLRAAFHGRNLASGQVQEALRGTFSPKYVKAYNDLARGKVAKGLAGHPLVTALARARGMDVAKLTDAQASDLTRQILRQYEVHGRHAGEVFQRVGQAAANEGSSFRDMLAEFAGGLGGTGRGVSAASILRKLAGREPGTTLNPLTGRMRGVGGAAETTLGPFAAGEELGAWIEGLNRAPGFLAETAAGVAPGEAARRVGAAQVQYGGRFYSPFEKQALRFVPFGKFMRGQAEYVARTLAERPGGRMAQTIRAANALRGDERPLPDYVAQTAAIPIPEGTPLIGPAPGGDRRYLTAFGLMHEDPLQLAGKPADVGLELLSRLNPMVKIPLELSTGQVFFQRGPHGGRDIRDLYPTVGSTLSNIMTLGKPAEEARAAKPVRVPRLIEHLASNLPGMPELRKLTDPRKRVSPDVPLPGLATLANLATGARLADIPPGVEDKILAEQAMKRLERTGVARSFEETYVPKDVIDSLPPEMRSEILQTQYLLKTLAERGRQRSKGQPVAPLGKPAGSW